MNQEYAAYLTSKTWKKKRKQRLKIGKHQCAACGSQTGLQIHHLTYARIFREEMSDLLPLCPYHHEKAEALVASGKLQRSEHVLFLAVETVRLVLDSVPVVAAPLPQTLPEETDLRNATQSLLMAERWFLDALAMQRQDFKRLVRHRFYGPERGKNLANAFTLYDRFKRHPPAYEDRLVGLIGQFSAD